MSTARSAPPRHRLGWRSTASALAAALLLAGCGSDKVSSVEVTSVTVRPATVTLVTGSTQRFTVDVRDQSGNSVPSSIGVEWSASPASVVSVDAGGLVTAVGPGNGTVRASAGGVSGSASLVVEPPPTISIDAVSAELAGLLGGDPPPEPVEVAVNNAGAGTLSGLVASVTYGTGQPTGWLTPSLESTTAPTTLRLSATATGLEVGDYDATVALTSSSAANSPFQVPVRLRVVADEPVLRATPALSGFSGVSRGDRPPDQTVQVENIGGGSLDDLGVQVVYDDDALGGWLTASLSTSTLPAELTLRADPGPLPPGTYRARARLTSQVALNAPKDVIVSFNVEARADVRVTKIGPDSAAAGTQVEYALQLRNEGPSVAEDVVFVDSLPGGVELVEEPVGAVVQGRVIRWDLGDLAPGTQRSFAVDIAIPSNRVGVVRNLAVATSPSTDPTPSSRVAEVVTNVVRAADLEVVKTGPDSVHAGTEATWSVVIRNPGPSDAVSVVVGDLLPDSVDFVSASDGGSVSGRELDWPVVPTLTAGDSLIRTVTVRVPSSRTGTLVNTAFAESAVRDPDPANDTSTVVTPVLVRADLEAIAEAPDTITAGTGTTLVAGVRNLGPSDAAAVVVRDSLPPGVTFVSASDGGVESGGVVTWPAIGVMEPGDSARYEVQVAVPASTLAALRHAVRVSSPTVDPGPAPDTASVESTLVTIADLALAKRGPATDTAGTAADYTLVVRNAGPSDARAVVVTDSLPAGATVSTVSSGGTASGGVVTWPAVPVLAAGDSVVRTVRVVLDEASTGTAVNVGSVTASTSDTTPADNRQAVSTTLLTRADLSMSKTGPATAVAGTTAVYELVARNEGPSTATAVVVTDTVPAGTTVVSATGGGAVSSGLVRWTIPSLAPGDSLVYGVTLRVDAARTAAFTNVGAVASAVTDPNGVDDRDAVTTAVQVQADLGVTTSGPASVTAGTNATWEVEVTNDGPSTATGVVVRDTLPAGVTYVTSDGGGTHAGGVVTWPTIATLAPGASRRFEVTVVVGPALSGSIVNVAAVTAASPDPAPADDRATATATVVASSDLSVTKTGAAVDTAGTAASWTVRATNAGPSTATGVVVRDTLPPGLTGVSASNGGVVSGNVVTWTVGTLAAGASTPIYSVTATIPASTTGALVNRARVTAGTADPTAANDRDQVSTTVFNSADLSVTKTGAAVDTAGTSTSWTVQASNAGPSVATGVVVSDTLPPGVTGVSASNGGVVSGNVVTWSVGTLAVGASTPSYTVTASLPASSSGSIVNRARVAASTSDPTAANDRDQVSTTVVASADLSVTKTGAAVDTAGTSTSWTVQASNAGPSVATGVVVSDTLPPGVTGVSASNGGVVSGNVVTWTVGSLGVGASTPNFTVTASLPASAGGALVNRARVASGSDDPVAGNDRDQVSTTVVAAVDLSVTKTGAAVDTAGTTTSWTVQATNAGPSNAAGVVVSDTLPPGVTGVSASNGGVVSGNVVTWAVGGLAAGASTPSYTVTATIPASASGSLLNRARVASSTAETAPGDNRAQVSTLVIAAADLSVAKTGAAVDTAGTSTSWTVQASNAGPSTATGVVVSDTLPPGVTGVSASNGGVVSGNVVTWTVGTLAAGASTPSFSVTATIPPSATGSMVNRARVAAGTIDPAAGNDRDQVSTTIVAAADLSVVKSGAAVDTAGTSTSWTVQATNAGPSAATGVVVSDTLPPGVTGVSASNGGVVSGNVVTWTVGPLAPGASTPTYTVSGTIGAATTGAMVNRARVAASTSDPTAANDRDQVSTTVVASADLSVTKTGAAVDTAGTSTSWTVQATNAGPSVATGVVVSDTLPPGVTGVSASNGGVVSGNVVTWSVGSLAPGASTPTYSVTATIPASTAGSMVNRARVAAGTPDPTGANDRDQVTTTVVAAADLSVAKSGAAVDTAGTSTSWTVQATNAGPSNATGVVVSDTLPPGVTGVSASNGGVVSGNVVTWTVGALAAGASTPSFSVTATIPASTTGSITNRARVAAATADPASGNDRDQVNTTVVAAADLSVSKSGAAVDTAGTSTSWTVQATNAGPSNAAGVVVSDTLPPGVTGVSASNGGVVSGNVVTWTVGALAAGASTPSYSVTATIPASTTGSMLNRARVVTSTADPTSGNDRSQVTTTVVAAADLSVAKTGAATDTAGTATSWTVQATNAGPSDATGVVVSDTLPPGVTGVSASNGGVVSGNVVTWTVGALAAGASTPTYSVAATIPASTTGSMVNRARVAAGSADPTPANDRSQVTTTVVAAADLSVTKTGAATDTAGTAISWTVQATNAGPSNATGVVVSDTLPPGLTGVSASNGGVVAGNVVTWTVGTLANGASTPAYTVSANIPASTTGSLSNRARVAAGSADPTPANDRDQVSTTVVAAADLSVTKTGAATDTAGTAISWTVQATNAGPSNATGVVVSDTLPPGLTGVSASNGGVVAGNVVTWTVGTLANGASTPAYTVSANIPASTTGSLSNRARVAATTADPTPANDRDQVNTTVVAAADLSVTKTGAATDTAGTAISWTVQATNAGPSNATGVVVSDTLPPGLTGVSASNGGVVAGNVVTWTVGTLANGASTPAYTVSGTIPPATTGSLVNRARVESSSSDPTPANDRDQVTTTVAAAADLVAGAGGPATATAGTQITFTVSVDNDGPSTASGVVVSDTLPAGVTFVSATGGGVHAAGVVTWPAASMAPGGPISYDVVVDIGGGTAGAITHTVVVTSSTADPTPGNDVATSTTTVSAPAPIPPLDPDVPLPLD
ncbi:hypothetical protein V3331_16295 [Gaopeijia maritima]|uniref:hypothetical protein n=1 Tax=Gaopeijia maritima TaxID=3119007 RepID=UPI00324D0AD2